MAMIRYGDGVLLLLNDNPLLQLVLVLTQSRDS